ncbi:PPK2 family polyphosphate kinase [Corynebacterium pseudodiphtheriticum]|uniref:PPK2 family polyphosphate--nucleotide phosphotransferase n=1 Tax=Corynebacterium pseudodiphtheriticum TaxID=37637 RepID=A0ABT7FY17_9CORY|nr:PPK2 family polyphosphate kinase [Corynebacterium pseudodiphtheriticum]MDK4273903.1 PPK2 family polyphosphate--nucleotide phosphotransferase [Corynebacterium pseudodiphtheriticum]MDK4290658.1 PPK2 family polyphosphate--nucleotide phosphotransferase [Corynebacterium pseudodiphtheriticum]MDK4328241.1 PPK2 family polyphosphate--nucleotide phosphotransferase [Corynebacterium pseudodiphtheriticum]
MRFKPKDVEQLRADLPVDLAAINPLSTPGYVGKVSGKRLRRRFHKFDEELRTLQEQLFAHARISASTDDSASGGRGTNRAGAILLILQGMDTSGKGGMIRNALSVFDPQGLKPISFGAPNAEELSHDFLWRIRKHTPQPGEIVVFDRSHYEDVLIQRVESMATPEEIERRYGAIVDFESELAAQGVTIIKVMLHISPGFQKKNLLRRLCRVDKRWKFDPSDIENRAKWDDYQRAYEVAIDRTDSDHAPWYIVPSDNKLYARTAVKFLLLRRLRAMGLNWPDPGYDVAVQQRRLSQ